jgi:UDP-N-acetylmuramoyl-L-alanine---L-glutamate ligase
MSETFSALRGKRIGIWGVGREARALAAQLERLLDQGIAVAVSDAPDSRGPGLAPTYTSGTELLGALLTCDVVVRSPGVSIYRSEVEALRARGIPVVTATSLWLAEPHDAPIVGVTGTKGKSTTASLIAHLLRSTGCTAELAGNVGRPAIELLGRPTPDVYVLELSSYQIADTQSGVDIAVFTTLFPEHVDWHGSSERYFADKVRLLELPPLRLAVLNACDRRLREITPTSPVVHYGCEGDFLVDGDAIVHRGKRIVADDDLPLRGAHNLLNLCAALTAVDAVGRVPADVRAAVASFQGLPHRLRSLGWRDGVEWIDDSISTTPESTIAALAAFSDDRRVVLIGGGFDRDQDYARLGREIARRGTMVIGLPTTGPRLIDAARQAGANASHLLDAHDLASAVSLARGSASAGGLVLLSPAAPSFGEFASFEERGRRFAELAGFVSP